jgi:hypothetical protein
LSRNDPPLTDGAKEALEGVGIDLSKRHVRPKQVSTTRTLTVGRVLTCAENVQKIEMMLAIGDSYTAGVGSGDE